MNIHEFWKVVLDQDEYIIANCEYPGERDGVVERINEIGDSLAKMEQ